MKASNSFVTPQLVDALTLHAVPTQQTTGMLVASGEKIIVQA